jgi:hypothetical protein
MPRNEDRLNEILTEHDARCTFRTSRGRCRRAKVPGYGDGCSLLGHSKEKTIPPSPERTVCLRKLLEAKDCAVRAKIDTLREG